MSKLIFDKLTKIPTILATTRAKRPDQTGTMAAKKDEKVAEKTAEPKKKVDFFAKGNEEMTPPTLYQDQEDWNVRIFSNKFPLLDKHEVIVHSPDDFEDLPNLSREQVVRYIEAILSRIDHYMKEGMEVFVFNNRGARAGASVTHPHSQLVALKGFPGVIEEKRESALGYFDEHGSCYWCDLIQDELEDKGRVIYESNHFVIIVPKASKWSYEMMLLPKRHLSNMVYINQEEISDLAKTLQGALHAYDELFDFPDRNYWFYTEKHEPFHWHMGFIPHIKVFGGLELGAGIWVNDKATPEDAASQLGKAVEDYFGSEK